MKVYKNTLLLCIFTILVTFIMKLFGYEGFHIPVINNVVSNNFIILLICYALLYLLNSTLIIILIVKRKLNIKEIIVLIIIFIIIYLLNTFVNIGYFKFLIEGTALILLSCILMKDFKISVEAILMYGFMLLYQVITLKTKGLIIEIMNDSFTNSLILQIDFYMLIIAALLYFLKKGEHLYELVYKIIRNIWWSKPFTRILSKRNCKEKCLQQNQEDVKEIKFEVGYFIFNIVLFAFQFVLILTICYFIKNTVLNILLIFISFVILRKTFGKSYHADTILKCTTISTILFITATELTLDVNISILSSIIVGVLLAYGMHVYYYYNNYVKCNSDLAKLPLDELRSVLHYLSDLEVNMVYDYWHKDSNITVDDIADKYGYNKMKVYRTLKKIKENNL